jgi:hypothetical protein
MDEQFKQLSLKVEYLEKMFNLNQQNTNFNIALSWSILGVAIAIVGVSLYFLIKIWFNKLVDERLKDIDFKEKRQMGEILV